MTCTIPSELFEPKDIEAEYLSFLVNEHRKVYPAIRAIVRLSYGRDKGEILTCQTETYKLIRLLEKMAPAGLSIDGMILWVEVAPNGNHIRHMVTKDQYES